jgi:K+-transporting ATPase A subunit
MTYYRNKDFYFWYITLASLVISGCYIWMPDGNTYKEWFDITMKVLFPISLVLHLIAIINMQKHKIHELV